MSEMSKPILARANEPFLFQRSAPLGARLEGERKASMQFVAPSSFETRPAVAPRDAVALDRVAI
jgi:hypothetical protein